MLENNECYETNKMLNWVSGNREFWGEESWRTRSSIKMAHWGRDTWAKPWKRWEINQWVFGGRASKPREYQIKTLRGCVWETQNAQHSYFGISKEEDFRVAPMVKNLPAMQGTRVRSLDQEDPLEKGMASQSSILAWRIPLTEESVGLQSVGLQRVRHDWVTNTHKKREGGQGGRERTWGQGSEYIRPLTVWALIRMKWLCLPCLHLRKRNLD